MLPREIAGSVVRLTRLVSALRQNVTPDDRHVVAFKQRIVRHERCTLHTCLGDQHSIEGVGMMRRQCPHLLGVTERHRQLFEIAVLHHPLERVRELVGQQSGSVSAMS
jgi:hypothetical protein